MNVHSSRLAMRQKYFRRKSRIPHTENTFTNSAFNPSSFCNSQFSFSFPLFVLRDCNEEESTGEIFEKTPSKIIRFETHTHTHTQRGNRGQVNDRKQNVRTLRCSSVQAGNFGEVSGLTSPHTSAAFLAAPEGNCARRSYFENNRDADGVSNSRESLREREIARLRFCFLSRLSSRIEH